MPDRLKITACGLSGAKETVEIHHPSSFRKMSTALVPPGKQASLIFLKELTL